MPLPIEFDEQNVKIAEHQDQYLTLPAYVNKAQGEITCCFQLTETEQKEIAETGKVWLTVLTFGGPLQPLRLTVFKPDMKEENEDD